MHATNFHQAFTTLQLHGAATLTGTEEGTRRLLIAEVQVCPDVFQPRQDVTETAEHGRHLAELIRSLQIQKKLAPIVVLKVNSIGWVCVDGFHRLTAYQEAKGRRTHIPVVVFQGTVDEALRFSIAENTPDKLNMSLADKRESAFKMVLCGRYAQTAISQAAGVSESTVDRMRRSLATVRKQWPGTAWETCTWINVKWTIRNDQERGEEASMWMEKRAQQVATILTKHLKGTAKDTPEVFADGLIRHVGDLEAATKLANDILARVAGRRARDDF